MTVQPAAFCATDNNVRVPEELLARMKASAQEKGKSMDELVTDAMTRYLANEWMNTLEREGQQLRRQLGLKTDDDVERYVDKAITEQRGR